MPTYEYLCKACGHEWEQEQSIKDRPIRECPECHQKKAQRQIPSRTGFVLRGKYWARDGYGPAKPPPI